MPAKAHRTLGSAIQITISAALTDIPLLFNIEIDPGENKVVDILPVDEAYELPLMTGVRSRGGFSADIYVDPTDAVHQFVAEKFADPGTVALVGAIVLAGTGETVACKIYFTKFPVSLKSAAAIEGKIEGVFEEQVDWPEGA